MKSLIQLADELEQEVGDRIDLLSKLQGTLYPAVLRKEIEQLRKARYHLLYPPTERKTNEL